MNPFELRISQFLVELTLREFYEYYHNEGVGMIFNHKGGAMIYDNLDLIESNSGCTRIDIDNDIKKEIWKSCKEDYLINFSEYKKHSLKQQKSYLEMFYKSRMAEYYLNKLTELENPVKIVFDIIRPKPDAFYYKFKLAREM